MTPVATPSPGHGECRGDRGDRQCGGAADGRGQGEREQGPLRHAVAQGRGEDRRQAGHEGHPRQPGHIGDHTDPIYLRGQELEIFRSSFPGGGGNPHDYCSPFSYLLNVLLDNFTPYKTNIYLWITKEVRDVNFG